MLRLELYVDDGADDLNDLTNIVNGGSSGHEKSGWSVEGGRLRDGMRLRRFMYLMV
jgi:hypothetical protein